MLGPWATEIWRALAVLLPAALLGLAFGHMALLLFLGTLSLLVYHLRQLSNLEYWMRSGGRSEPPDVSGMWSEVYHQHYRSRRRNRNRKRQLMEMLTRFNETAAALPDATVVLGERGEILWFNEAARRWLGLRAPGDIGQRIDNLIRFPAFVSYLHGADYSERVEIPCPEEEDGVLSVAIVPYGENQKLLVAQDITRLTRLEQMRRDFVANISHELKTPLTVIAGYLETLRDAGDAALGKWTRSIDLMQQQAERMKSIVNDLLFLSRLEGQRLAATQPVNVPELLETVRIEAQALSRKAPKPHSIVVDADPSLWLYGDEAELHSAFSNLVYNAVAYSPEGGRIMLRWGRVEDGAQFAVTDQGMGIPANQIARVTERFYRVDVSRSRQSGGTGLGLSIVKHVLNRHQAQLLIESEVGKGSTFTCVFPAEKLLQKEPRIVTNIISFDGSDQKRRKPL